jgi:hypothetical protein
MENTRFIASDHPLSTEERNALRCLVGIIIPASAEYGVPGADDETIFADILATLVPSAKQVTETLRQLDTIAGGMFAELDANEQHAASERFRTSASPLVSLVTALVAQCYYRDDRVMRSLGMEPRPPFPLGFAVEDGDWSLLEAVRARPQLYRDAP